MRVTLLTSAFATEDEIESAGVLILAYPIQIRERIVMRKKVTDHASATFLLHFYLCLRNFHGHFGWVAGCICIAI